MEIYYQKEFELLNYIANLHSELYKTSDNHLALISSDSCFIFNGYVGLIQHINLRTQLLNLEDGTIHEVLKYDFDKAIKLGIIAKLF